MSEKNSKAASPEPKLEQHNEAKENTRQKLLLTAGKLFALHGYDGVSTRMIAETAQVNLGGIHYHFGSKEKLYVAAFRYASNKDERTCLGNVAEDFPDLLLTAEGQTEIIRITALRLFRDFFSSNKEEWQKRLLIRELSAPSSAQPILLQEIFQPAVEGDLAFLRQVRPDANKQIMLVWANFLHAQVIFYLMVREPLEKMFEPGFLDGDYFDTAALETAKALAMLLGLPTHNLK